MNNKIKARLIFNFMNKISKHDYQYLIENEKAICKRLSINKYTTMKIFRMLKYKWHNWKSTDMEKYFRPTTLFNSMHFDEYYQQVDYVWKKEKESWRWYWENKIRNPKVIEDVKVKIRELYGK